MPRRLRETPLVPDVPRAMVKLYKEQFGRGPETVWTYHSGPDAITSVLANSLTPLIAS
jgi:hypothetical protein